MRDIFALECGDTARLTPGQDVAGIKSIQSSVG